MTHLAAGVMWGWDKGEILGTEVVRGGLHRWLILWDLTEDIQNAIAVSNCTQSLCKTGSLKDTAS